MVRIAVLDITGCDADEFEAQNPIPDTVKKRIEKAKNPGERILKYAAYALLAKIYSEMRCGKEIPEIIDTSHGKPRFDDSFVNCGLDFNISHDNGAVAVAISDKEVGVDLQSHGASTGAAARIGTRFANALAMLDEREGEVSDISFSFFVVCDGKISEKCGKEAEIDVLAKEKSSCDFFARWTVLEAALKLDGGGFASIGKLEDVVRNAIFKTFTFKLRDKKYTLTVATEKE